MDKFLIRKDVYDELIEKGYGKKDLSKLTKKKITDKNGHTRTVYVRNGEQPATQNQPKAQDELTPEKKARYEEMLEKVKAGPDENALFVSTKGMLNKKDAIAHLEAKLGKKPMNSAYQGHLESENPPNTDITKEDEERFGKQALSGLSGKRTNSEEYDDDKAFEEYKELVTRDNNTDEEYKRIGELVNQHFDHSDKPWPGGAKLKAEAKKTESPKKADTSSFSKEDKINILSEYQSKMYKDVPVEKWKEAYSKVSEKELNDGFDKFAENHSKRIEEYKENYLDAKNEAGKDIAENNKIQKLSDKIEFSPEEMKMIRETADEIGYKVGKDEGKLLNAIYSKDKAMYSALTKKNQKVWDESGKTQKTFSSTDLLKEKIQSMNGDFGVNNSDSKFDEEDDTNKVSFEDSVKEYNFTDTKKNQFAMNEVANFYPELKDIVENRRKAFYEVNAAEKKLKVNPNNKEYKDNFASAYNKLKQADEEYDKASKKALEKAPNIKKPDFSRYMDAKRDVQKFLDKYKQQSEEYEVGQRLRNNGGASILSPMYGLKPDDYTKDPDYIKAQMTIRAYEEK